MILELSGYLNYNYHCDNVLWLWSVLLEDQNKISFKPGVLGFRSTLLSSSSSGGLRARSQLFTSHIQHPGPEGCMLALGLTCILSKVSLSEWQSLYFNITVTMDSLVTSGWSVRFPVHTPLSLVLPHTTNYNMTAFLSFKIMSRSDLDSVVFSLLCAF